MQEACDNGFQASWKRSPGVLSKLPALQRFESSPGLGSASIVVFHTQHRAGQSRAAWLRWAAKRRRVLTHAPLSRKCSIWVPTPHRLSALQRSRSFGRKTHMETLDQMNPLVRVFVCLFFGGLEPLPQPIPGKMEDTCPNQNCRRRISALLLCMNLDTPLLCRAFLMTHLDSAMFAF